MPCPVNWPGSSHVRTVLQDNKAPLWFVSNSWHAAEQMNSQQQPHPTACLHLLHESIVCWVWSCTTLAVLLGTHVLCPNCLQRPNCCNPCCLLPQVVLMRVHASSSDLFDRQVEIDTFKGVSRAGLGPQLLLLFNNGRIEEFLSQHVSTLLWPLVLHSSCCHCDD